MPKTVESLTMENLTLRHAVKQYHRKSMLESAELLPPDKRLMVLMRLYAEDNDWIQCPQTLTGNIKSLLQLFDKLTADNARLLKRVDDLEVAVANSMNDATRFVDRNGWLESEHERLKYRVAELERENADLQDRLQDAQR